MKLDGGKKNVFNVYSFLRIDGNRLMLNCNQLAFDSIDHIGGFQFHGRDFLTFFTL